MSITTTCDITQLKLSTSRISIVPHVLLESFNKVEAALIHQINYWTIKEQGVVHEGNRYIYNLQKEWARQLKVSVRTAGRAFASLVKRGVITIKKLCKNPRYRMNFVTLNYDVLAENLTSPSKKSDGSSAGVSSHAIQPKWRLEDKDYIHNNQVLENVKKQPQVERLSTGMKGLGNVLESVVGKATGQTIKPQKRDIGNRQTQQTAFEMLRIWNLAIPEMCTSMSKELARDLVAAYNLKFKKNMEAWRQFVSLTKNQMDMLEVESLKEATRFKFIDSVIKKSTNLISKFIPKPKPIWKESPPPQPQMTKEDIVKVLVEGKTNNEVLEARLLSLAKSFGITTS
jgi:hypothetical protein